MKVDFGALALPGAAALLAVIPGAAVARGIDYVQLAVPSPIEAVRWYTEHMECEPSEEQADAVDCHGVEIVFGTASTLGGTPGTGVNHIGFSFPDLEAKMSELEAVGVGGAGVRLQRFEDGSTFRDVPGLFKLAFIFDPWGTRIELAEDLDYLGFHQIHLSSADPAATLAWYQNVFGGEPALLRGRLEGLLFDDVWLFVSRHEEGVPAPTAGRTLDHLGFVVEDFDVAAADMREQRVVFGDALTAAAASAQRGRPAGPEDLSSWVRCITRGLPEMMLPRVYNNGLQIVQGPGFVAVQKEMIHETRVIPTDGRPHLGPNLTQWLGDSRGTWEGDTLVVEVTNFNGKASYRGSGEDMTLIERYARTGPDTLEYWFTVDDPTIWTAPWTGMFTFGRDDDQYELVEYACHEGNYGMTNILSGARAEEREQDSQQ